VFGEGGKRLTSEPFSTTALVYRNDMTAPPKKSRLQSMELTHPDRLVENATAPSAGGFPDPDGKAATFSDDLYLEGIRKGQWRSKIGVGVAIGLGIEGTRDGIRPFRTGYHNRIVAVLTQLGSEV